MQNRKDDHVKFALNQYDSHSNFDRIKLKHNSLPTLDLSDIDISTSINGLNLEIPFYINAMSGGSIKTKEINQKLAEVASKTNIAIASGSLSAALKDSSLAHTFSVLREHNRNGLIFANIGAEYNLEKAKEAISILNADVLQIHLNVIQEVVMEEGDREFSSWSKNIKEIVENVDVPVIVKEVGFGMSQKSIKALIDLGVKNIDVSGSGGTNFARIENARRTHNKYDYFNDFGISTVDSLLEAQKYNDEVTIIASGGIKSALDIVKSLVLGAKAVGVAGAILKSVEDDGVDKTVDLINSWISEIKVLMLVLGCRNVQELNEFEDYWLK